jgi:hypothetical protein
MDFSNTGTMGTLRHEVMIISSDEGAIHQTIPDESAIHQGSVAKAVHRKKGDSLQSGRVRPTMHGARQARGCVINDLQMQCPTCELFLVGGRLRCDRFRPTSAAVPHGAHQRRVAGLSEP